MNSEIKKIKGENFYGRRKKRMLFDAFDRR